MYGQALEAVEAMKKRSAALQQEEIATMAQMEEQLTEISWKFWGYGLRI